jgi:phenylpropionate dioxygenase-like ring-hydroxylating dioxygenase large terminal subunit
VVFHDSLQRVGVLGEHCPHRAASLFFGRNEEAGLRCVYHGWKFDVDGQCVELPSEPPDSSMCSKVHARACKTKIAGGILWVYMGTTERAPELPAFEWLGLPAERVYISRWVAGWTTAPWPPCAASRAIFASRSRPEIAQAQPMSTP